MPTPRRSKRLELKAKRKDKTNSNICNKCDDWCLPICTKDPGAICSDCPHSYHDRCIPSELQNSDIDCNDLGLKCDNEAPPIQFELPQLKDHTLHRNKKVFKSRSRRQSKSTNKRRKEIHKKHYNSFKYCHIEYKIGDDVVVECENDNDTITKEVARITHIYTHDDDKMPKMWLLWFWKATECDSDMRNNDDMDDARYHEIHIDETYAQGLDVSALASTQTSKALVVSSLDEYLQATQSIHNKDTYYDIYWCTHSYQHETKKKQLLPPGAISKQRIESVSITPSNNKKHRKRDRKTVIEQLLNDASKALMLSTIPETLLCREKEHEEITNYLKQQLQSHGQGSGLYISGMPGTGKTATVRQITNELQKLTGNTRARARGRRKKEQLPEFEFHEINAMKLPTPSHIYTELAQKLMNIHFAPNTAVRKLGEYFATKDDNRKICVLLVDELDFLLTRQQKVIYNIFDWPTKQHGKLVVIGIANTMDLPERLLPRVSSRLGTRRVVFKPYHRHQLTQIIEQRLESTKVFSSDAIRFCASAVAGVSGDCRTALQICRRAVEIAQKYILENGIGHLVENNNRNKKRMRTRGINKNKKKNDCNDDDDDGENIVSLQHLKSAKDAFDQTNDIQIVSTCSIYEKLFLTAIVICNTQSDGFAGMTSKYRQKFDNFVQTKLGEAKMGTVYFRNMVERLKDVGIVSVSFDKKEWTEFITFNVKLDEAAHALKENDVCAKILSTLQV